MYIIKPAIKLLNSIQALAQDPYRYFKCS